jgi:hypothetical protein
LSFDEGVEIGIGEHLARAALAVADGDIFERADSDVAVKRLDRAAELARGRGGREEAIGRRCPRRTALPLGAVGLAVPTQFADVLQVRLDLFHAVMAAPVFPAGIGAEVIGPQPVVCRLDIDENLQSQFDLTHPLPEVVVSARLTRVRLGRFCGMWKVGHATAAPTA